MRRRAKQSDVAVFLLAASGLFPLAGTVSAQAPLPATAPTSVTPSQLPSANPPAAQRGPLNMHWDGHLLQIQADGESLSGVLRAVASRAGLHMTGSLPDDPIFGTYGPAPLVDVLSDLVSGLSINMLYAEHTGNTPGELTFTARNGSATPSGSAPPQQYAQQQSPDAPPSAQAPPPAGSQPGGPAGGANGGPPAASTSDANSTNPTSPNGVRTPQEIFEQLQRLRANASASK